VVDAVAAETASDPEQVRSAYGPGLHKQFQPSLDAVAVAGLEQQSAFLAEHGFIPARVPMQGWLIAGPLQRARELVASGLVPPVGPVVAELP
jgi:ABC-type nitrate/sulfonate/bicarbonate transport system substrate-binding protein